MKNGYGYIEVNERVELRKGDHVGMRTGRRIDWVKSFKVLDIQRGMILLQRIFTPHEPDDGSADWTFLSVEEFGEKLAFIYAS